MREMEEINKLQTTTKMATLPMRHSQNLKCLYLWPKVILEASLITIKTEGEESIERSSKLKPQLKLVKLKLRLIEN